MSNELLKNLEDLDNLLQKAQICRGGNSERREWAGSDHTDEQIPSPAPDGTTYKPQKTVANKAVGDMTLDELEHYLALRKSGIPNPRAAEEEILQMEGVTKSICPSCNGVGQDAINKSMCGVCGGHGIIFECGNEQSVQMAKSIADRHNVGPDSMSKGKRAETTPTSAESFVGENASKGGDDPDMDLEDLEASLASLTKADNYDDDDDDGDDDDFGGDSEEMGKSLEALNYGMRVLLKSMKEILEVNDDTSELVQALAKSQVSMTKSLTGVEEARPARAPLAAGPGLRVLEKGFIDAAPGGGGSTYDASSLKKAASDMVYHGKLDAMEVLRMDAGVGLTPDTQGQIESWIRSNGHPKQ
jgi:hypothetical protein